MTQPNCSDVDLSCPAGVNFAAIAKQLHETALQAEDKIRCLEDGLLSAINKPLFIQRTNLTVAVADGVNGSILNTQAGMVTLFKNSDLEYSGAWEGRHPSLRSMYWVGGFIEATAAGVVDDNTYRRLAIEVRGISDLNISYSSNKTLFENNVGLGGRMSVTDVISMTGRELVQFRFSHGNTSSSMNVTSARFWVHQLSHSEVQEVL